MFKIMIIKFIIEYTRNTQVKNTYSLDYVSIEIKIETPTQISNKYN